MSRASAPRARVRVRQHVNPLGLAFETFRGDVPAIAPSCEIELEIGCAEAQFLFERAEQGRGQDSARPRMYLGLEIREALVDWVNREAASRDLPVRAIFCNANNHLRDILGQSKARRVFVNFPDPWFKKRHRKRRMLDESLARDIHAVLAPGGEVFFQSDVWDVALDALEVFERFCDLYENRAGAWSFWKQGNPYGVRSWREAHCEEAGLAIWRLWYRRR